MKVLFVQKEGGIFGAENYQLKVIPGLLTKGVDVEFLRLYTNYQGGIGGDFVDQLNEHNVKVYEINIGHYPSLRTLLKIKRIVRESKCDLIHTHLIHADFHLALVKSFLGLPVPIISTKHGYDNKFTSQFGFDSSKQGNTAYFLISRWSEKRMRASFTISNGLRNFFIETGLSNSKKMKLIHYGFDLPENHLYKGRDGFRKAEKQIIIAGRLVAFKGHKFLIESMSKVVESLGPRVNLLIAGTGDLDKELKALTQDLRLTNSVKFLGYSKDVGALMANSDAVIIPSLSEGFGVVFLEAFSAKTPVISWDVPAGNELIKNNDNGYLVPAYDVNLLADKILDVLNRPEDQKRIVESAYDKLKSYFNLDRMINETIAVYNDVLHNSKETN